MSISTYLWSWFSGVLNFLGLGQKKGKLLFVGLDNAGKTSLMHVIKTGRVSMQPPTYYPTSEELSMGGMTFKAFDLGGHPHARRVWRDYYHDLDGLVFILDCADRSRFDEAKAELDSVLDNPDIGEVPILILANKIDMINAVGERELISYFGLWHKLYTQKGRTPEDETRKRPINLVMCSVHQKEGYGRGFRWLAQFI